MLTSHDLETFRQQLHTMRGRLDGRVSQLRSDASQSTGGESAGGISNAPLHLADLGSQEAEESVSVGLAEKEASMRQEIDEAIRRLDEETYGICEECQQPIAHERLHAVPYSRLCIRCAKRLERRSHT